MVTSSSGPARGGRRSWGRSWSGIAPIQSRELELHSLSLQPLVAEHSGGESWTPTRPGVELKPIPDAPAPAASPAQRLRQIRELAKVSRRSRSPTPATPTTCG